MREQKNRRKALRVPASLIARCCQKNLNEVGMRVHDLSIGGMGIKTNYPLSLKERLAVSFQLKNNLSKVLCVTGEVAWLQYHGDNPGPEETFFSGGIKFLNLQESSVVILLQYVWGLVG